MHFSESETIQKENNLISRRRKVINRLRLDALCVSLILFLAFAVAAVFHGLEMVKGIFDSAPLIGEEQLLSQGYATTVYDREGEELQTLDVSWGERTYVSSSQISDAVKNAFIAVEDPRFYEHHGIDVRGMLRSLQAGLTGEEQERSEATMTQRLLSNRVFENEDSTSIFSMLSRKIQQQYMSVKLEEELGKDKILEYYLNTVSFGDNLIGIQEASRFYFNKDAEDITVSEAAVLVALAQDPAKYDPIHSASANASRRSLVLESMLNINCISEEEYEDALGEDVYMELQGAREKERGVSAAKSYYVDAVITQVIEDLKEKLGYNETMAYHAVYQGGLKIYSCQDQDIQKVCDQQIEASSQRAEKDQQVSFVLVEQKTGQIKALVGGWKEDKVRIEKNRGIDFVREPGTVFPLISTWLPALDTAGLTLGSVEDDGLYEYAGNGPLEKGIQVTGTMGLVTMRDSILQSIQIPALKTLEKVHVQTGYDYLRNLGISTLIDKQENGDGTVDSDIDLSMASGQLLQGVSNLELTAAYAALGNEGKYVAPAFYTKVIDQDGNVLLENQVEEKKIIKKSTAWLLTNVLIENGGSQPSHEAGAAGSSLQIAGIAGSSKGKRDYWFQGYTPFYTAGLWCGKDDLSGQKAASYCQQIWTEIMNKVHRVKNIETKSMEMPSDIVERKICVKCGNLAVTGLCEEALGGDCSRREYFVRGSEPVKNCDCHVRYYICTESGELAGPNCPEEAVKSRVYLMKKETRDTEDTPYIISEQLAQSLCEKHTR